MPVFAVQRNARCSAFRELDAPTTTVPSALIAWPKDDAWPGGPLTYRLPSCVTEPVTWAWALTPSSDTLVATAAINRRRACSPTFEM